MNKTKEKMMSILDIKNMTTTEKIMAMEELWADMDKTAEANDYITPQWHKDILDEREKKVKSGEAKFLSIAEVKEEFKNSRK